VLVVFCNPELIACPENSCVAHPGRVYHWIRPEGAASMKRRIALILLAPLFILSAGVKPMAGTLAAPTVTDLYNFTDGNDGYYPYSGLLVGADGNLYGTTRDGGTQGAYGTVFELSRSNGGWTETVLV
jgi:hypothetical protein